MDNRHVNKKINNLVKHFGFSREELCEVRKMYSGEVFDRNDPAYLKLLQCSEEICKRYDDLLMAEMADKAGSKRLKLNIFAFLKYYFKKSRLLKLIFPVHGFVLYAESGIRAVIGLVDLKGYGFINKNLVFSPCSLVKIEKANVFAFNISVGESEFLERFCRLEEVVIDKNCWIGAGVKIIGGVHIGRDTVVGAGAVVREDIPQFSLVLGRPGKIVRHIGKADRLKAVDCNDNIDSDIIDTVKKINNDKMPSSYIDMLRGKPFNAIDKKLSYLYSLTRQLCYEYSQDDTSQRRKEEILDMLFVKHGKNIRVGKGLYVDMLGTVRLGDDVVLGDNVFLGGNVDIKDNVRLEDGTVVFASGHGLLAKERLMTFSLKRGLYELTQYNKITIEKGVCIGRDSLIVQGSIVDVDVPSDSVFVKGKIIR